MRLDIAALSDIGRRKKENEDSYGVFLANPGTTPLIREGAFLVVADGLGGHMGGEIASKLSVSIVKDVLTEQTPPPDNDGNPDRPIMALLEKHTKKSNASVWQTNEDMNTGAKPMGTTLVTALVSARKVHISNVGDSRVYHIREGKIIAFTEDHSWVDEQVKLGLMSKAEAESDSRRNIVTRSIGTRPEVDVDTYMWPIEPGDWLLVCSDGLINMVSDSNILAEFTDGSMAADIVARLVDMANENGGKDNITAIAVNISPSFFRLVVLRMRSFRKKHGIKLLSLLVVIVAGLLGYMLGYWHRGLGS